MRDAIREGPPVEATERPLVTKLDWRTACLIPPAVWINRALSSFTRVRYLHREREENALVQYGVVIYAFWHGRFWLLPTRLRQKGITVLVSRSKDGEIVTRALRRLGHHVARGSSSQGGREGLSELEAVIRRGGSVGITPDGPRGPRHRAQMGAVVLAARSGRPIIPLGVSSKPAKTLSSWDRFQIPLPFARGAIVFGEPMLVPNEEDLESWRASLEQALNEVTEEADREVSR